MKDSITFMRRIPSIKIGGMIIVTLVVGGLLGACGYNGKGGRYLTDTAVENTVGAVGTMVENAVMDGDTVSEAASDDGSGVAKGPGDGASEEDMSRVNLITEDGRVKLYAYFGPETEEYNSGDDITSNDDTILIRHVDNVAKDTMLLVGPYSRLLGHGKLCRIVVGVDTVNVNIHRPLKKRLDLRYTDIIPGCGYYRFSKHFQLSDRSFPTDFQINIAMPDSAPEYIRHFLNKMIRDDVAAYFGDYSREETVYPSIPLYDIQAGSVPQMSQHYYRHFRKLYRKEFGSEAGADEVPLGPCYSYQLYAYPVWESKDGENTTWKFYHYGYSGGAHGWRSEYYLTFNSDTGKPLGAMDFYTEEKFRKSVSVLERQLNAYHGREPGGEYSHVAELYDVNDEDRSTDEVLNEVIQGKVYPRPALTRQGIVFSYQTYEKGSNADGVLHFTQPYRNKIK